MSEPSCPREAHSRFKENKYALKKPGDITMSEGHRYPPVVLLGGKGVRVSTPFINAFQKKKAWNLPKSSTNLGLFFSSSKCGDFKTFFFPSCKCRDLVFFLEIFQNAHFTMYVFMGDFLADFHHKKNKNKNNNCFAPLCVCLSVVK